MNFLTYLTTDKIALIVTIIAAALVFAVFRKDIKKAPKKDR